VGQDAVLTRDDIPVVFHDLVLEEVTNVAMRFPERRRPDGRWYVIDLDFAELQTLQEHASGYNRAMNRPSTPAAFMSASSCASVRSAEELAFIRGLNASTGRHAGIYTEVKSPAWHQAEGKDPSPIILSTLAEFGYASPDDDVWLQLLRRQGPCCASSANWVAGYRLGQPA
jgi:glycerophosphoryl diester phosphodiesterase